MTLLTQAAPILLAFALTAPVVAQPAPAAPAPIVAAPSAEPPTADSARLTAAAVTVDALFPIGSYERMMRGSIDKMMGSMLSTMTGMTPRQIGVENAGDEADVPLGELVGAADPAFEERMRLSTTVMMDEMIGLMSEAEPAVRDALTRSFARRYTVGQLGEMNVFFATPAGAAFARDYLMTFTDPEMIEAMQAFVPKMMQRLPTIMAKVQDATAHLPPAIDTTGDVELDTDATLGTADEYDPVNWSARDRARYDRARQRMTDSADALERIADEAAARARVAPTGG